MSDGALHNDSRDADRQVRNTLAISLRKGGVDVKRRTGGETELFSVDVDAAIQDGEKIVEEAVYATPSLLGDYAQTAIVVDAPRFTLVPEDVAADPEALDAIRRLMWPDAAKEAVTVSDAAYGVAVVASVDAALSGFVGRTFGRSTIVHRMAALCRFFASLSRPVNNIKIYANFASPKRLDIIAMTAETLLMANSFDCNAPEDAVYYIMAAVKDCGFDQLDDELLLSGDVESCRKITDTLRRYVNSVMPLLLPENIKNCPLELQNICV